MQYSYQFARAAAGVDLVERYASQPELLAYIEHVADRSTCAATTFGTRIEQAAFEADHRWSAPPTGRGGGGPVPPAWRRRARPRDPGLPRPTPTGAAPSTPAPGRTADFAGQRVGVGTGSSGIQSIPVLAEQAAQRFQRTPNYVVPARNRPSGPTRWRRSRPTTTAAGPGRAADRLPVPVQPGSIHDVDEAERRRRLDASGRSAACASSAPSATS